MDFLKRLNTMYWHDGVFLRSQVTITHEMTLDLEIELYDNDTAYFKDVEIKLKDKKQ